MKLKELFEVRYGNANDANTYEKGKVPYVSSGSKNNGVVGFVDTDKELFDKYSITIAAKGSIGSSFVQPLPFIASKDNVIVLKEKKGVKLSIEEKYFISAYINKLKWRYSYGRTLSKRRVENIELKKISRLIDFDKTFKKLIPSKKTKFLIPPVFNFKYFVLTDLFEIKRGRGDYLINYEKGNIPLISATNENNGIVGYINDDPAFKAPCITVERVSGTAFVQLKDFVTVPDDVLVLTPKQENFPIEFLFYISVLINNKKWKYCYGRKLSKGRLKKFVLCLPVNKQEEIDTSYIMQIVNSQYGWEVIEKAISS